MSMNWDFNLSNFNWRDFGRSQPFDKVHRIPVEIFSEIFADRVQAVPSSQGRLMRVCRHWYDIMLSTPGIHSQLRINWWTRKQDVERFGRRWLLDVIVDVHYERDELDYLIGDFVLPFMTAAEVASRWRSLALVSLPPPSKCKDLQITQPLEHLESFKLAASCDLGNFLKPLFTAITTTAAPHLTVMEVLHSDAALHLVHSAQFQIFSSLTTLKLYCGKMQDPVDILPHFCKLETFEAHHLLLPIYPPSVDLPLIQTLRVLHLKSVSVQWLTDQVFPALEECSIIFPHHADAIQKSVYMPLCSILKYDSNNLGALEHFRILHLDKLGVKCGQCKPWRGDLQLVPLHPIFVAQSLICLRLRIKCSGRLLTYMLGLVPSLKELWLGLSSPHALSRAFFLAFAAGRPNTSAMIGSSGQTIAPLCRELTK